MWVRRIILVALLGLVGGCASQNAPWAALTDAARDERHRATQADVNEFNDAVAAASNLHYDDAIKKLAPLLKIFENANDTAHASECLFWLGFCYEKTKRAPEATVFYQRVIRNYPQTRSAEQAQERLSRMEPPKVAR